MCHTWLPLLVGICHIIFMVDHRVECFIGKVPARLFNVVGTRIWRGNLAFKDAINNGAKHVALGLTYYVKKHNIDYAYTSKRQKIPKMWPS